MLTDAITDSSAAVAVTRTLRIGRAASAVTIRTNSTLFHPWDRLAPRLKANSIGRPTCWPAIFSTFVMAMYTIRTVTKGVGFLGYGLSN